MFERLVLDNFGAFKKAEFQFSAGVNVFIGANGTGKTHLMKLIYCLQQQGHDADALEKKLVNVFRPGKGNISRLVHRPRGSDTAVVTLKTTDGKKLKLSFDNTRHHNFKVSGSLATADAPVYIPVKEVLSFAPGFVSLYDKYELAFEEVYYDIIKQAYLPVRKGMPLNNEQPLLELIRKTVGGKVTLSGEEFQLSAGNSKLEISLVAEGHRKLALIWQLIHNGSLFANNTLFWDEPEANLNPSLMQDVAKVLLMLAERGVQVFVATHNYAFLRELDFAKGEVATRYFALEKDDQQGVVPHAWEQYRDITPNKIAEEYQRLYDLEIQNSLGGVKEWSKNNFPILNSVFLM
ncbi:ATP/GTP-binding protein, partial [Endozoicomonas sp. ONNA2]|uniref:AAA family ATPase n=1 Tax=Endozoicomonas sp. ONNA2 TaxID=2828741 RepID=UPI002148443B